MLLVTADAVPAHADAGASVLSAPGAQFSLNGFAEGFAGEPSATWSAPEGCTILSQGLDALATCDAVGKHAFTFTASDGASSASDTVAVGIVLATTTVVAEAAGETTAGALGVHVAPIDPIPFNVPEGATKLVATLTWEYDSDDYDFTLTDGEESYSATSTEEGQEVLELDDPAPGSWNATVEPYVAYLNDWELVIEAVTSDGFRAELPTVRAPGWAGAPGTTARLAASASGGNGALSYAWESDPGSRRFDDGSGPVFDMPFDGPSFAYVKVTDAEGYEAIGKVALETAGSRARPLTVVAVIDSGFSVYHHDFLASMHPWNVDADPGNDIDLFAHPATHIAAYPTDAGMLQLSLPTADSDDSDELRGSDEEVWDTMLLSNATSASLYWIPGTKVIGAMRFGSAFASTNDAHGSASASVAAGNVHGSCPECLFVLIAGGTPDALAWAASQPWIDVITNSYGHGSVVQTGTLGFTRDNIYLRSPVETTKAASEEGQVIVFSAGNGFVNAFDVPMFTYWSSEKGPDWMVTVGAVAPQSEQTVMGAGKPVDISSIGGEYPASGGTTPDGEGQHSGTSNAAPVTAGYFAKVLQRSREILGDATPGHAGGVVASGEPVACGAAWSECPLADGLLTRRELEDLVFHNVLPSPMNVTDVVHVPPLGYIPYATWPSTEHAYYYQGHGVLTGRMQGDAEYEAEWTRMVDAAIGRVAPLPRPVGETEWFVSDSKCRQAVWGSWTGGYYTGQPRTVDVLENPLAVAYDVWCSQLPSGTVAGMAPMLATVVNAA